MNDIVGKTVAVVEVQQWAGTDMFKETVTWERTVITWTDGTSTGFDAWDGERFEEYRAIFDDEGQPHELVTETTACRHCGHGIGQDHDGTWVAPDAGFDVEGGDGIWRDICPDRDDEPNPPHEPSPIVPSFEERTAEDRTPAGWIDGVPQFWDANSRSWMALPRLDER